jgi:hypothetical protein
VDSAEMTLSIACSTGLSIACWIVVNIWGFIAPTVHPARHP